MQLYLAKVAKDGPDQSVIASALFQRMATPPARTEECFNRAIRYLFSHPRGVFVIPQGLVEETWRVWTENGWVGDVRIWKSSSHSNIKSNGGTAGHWSNTHSNVVLSSGESELNGTLRGMSMMRRVPQCLARPLGGRSEDDLSCGLQEGEALEHHTVLGPRGTRS